MVGQSNGKSEESEERVPSGSCTARESSTLFQEFYVTFIFQSDKRIYLD